MRRLFALLCAFIALMCALPAFAGAQSESQLRRALSAAMRGAGSGSGAYVLNATDRDVLFRSRDRRRRILASNTKLFTTAAALAQFGTAGTLPTTVLGEGSRDASGVFTGDLYLKGGGDPSLGSRTFIRRKFGGDGADIGALADQLAAGGITRVRGRIIGDESRFDALRGGPDSRFGVSVWVGPLSALAYNRGLANEFGSAFQSNPPAFAAGKLDDALEARGIRVSAAPRAGVAVPAAVELAAVQSPPIARISQLTNKHSDNFFAEMLVKAIEASRNGKGTTTAGAKAAARFARRLGAAARLVDGSGLSRGNRASPRAVAELLDEMRARDEFQAFYDSLPVAGRDGTLRKRMRRGPARRNCRAKTGTLIGVSSLSGYCESAGGDTIVFSILLNRVGSARAKRLEDRMVQAIARFRG